MNEEIKNLVPENSETKHIIASDNSDHKAKIKIVGVGGAGGNAVNRMVNMDIKDVEFISINTDALALDNSLADEKIAIGQKTTKTLGAGAKPEVGRQALIEDKDTVKKKLEGADMVFISAGMGGGTGTGAAPVVAELAHELGILTVAVVTMPFKWEGPVRRRNAEKGLAALRSAVDSIIVINNQRIMDVIEKTTTMKDAFLKVDEVLGNAVRSICDIMFIHGTINVDFNDARTIMSNGGSALMGTGTAAGEDRTLHAAELAIACPLLDNVKVNGAAGALINVAHGENFSMSEYDAAMEYLYQQIGEDNEPNIVAGDVTIPSMGDRVSITVIATGFDRRMEEEMESRMPVEEKKVGVSAASRKQTVESSIPRQTANFVAMAKGEEAVAVAVKPAPEAPTISLSEVSCTGRQHTIREVSVPQPVAVSDEEELSFEKRPAKSSKMPFGFGDGEFNLSRSLPEDEIVRSKSDEPTIPMPKTNAAPVFDAFVKGQEDSAPAFNKAPMAAKEKFALGPEENNYGQPAFLQNNGISESDF